MATYNDLFTDQNQFSNRDLCYSLKNVGSRVLVFNLRVKEILWVSLACMPLILPFGTWAITFNVSVLAAIALIRLLFTKKNILRIYYFFIFDKNTLIPNTENFPYIESSNEKQ